MSAVGQARSGGSIGALRGLSNRDIAIYAAVGFTVWLNGALTFRLGGAFLFENGLAVGVLVALVIAVAVCLIFRSTMRWRGALETEAVTIAVVMALPGLFGETARQTVFSWATGMRVEADPQFAATIFFGNAILQIYALAMARRAHAREAQAAVRPV